MTQERYESRFKSIYRCTPQQILDLLSSGITAVRVADHLCIDYAVVKRVKSKYSKEYQYDSLGVVVATEIVAQSADARTPGSASADGKAS